MPKILKFMVAELDNDIKLTGGVEKERQARDDDDEEEEMLKRAIALSLAEE